jgi:hypothetical protein
MVLLGLVAGCGRLGFDATTDASGDPATNIPDLVVVYPMDDDPRSGTVTSTVPAYDAVCTSCPSPTTGKIGGAYAFDGTVEIHLPEPSAGLVGMNPYTVALWASPSIEISNDNETLLAKPYSATTDANVLSLWVSTMGTPAGQLSYETTRTGASGDYQFAVAPPDQDYRGAWHHVAMSWNGTTKRLYLDGVLVDLQDVTTADSNEVMLIGADLDENALSHNFTGTLDELRFYARALSDAEVATLAGS